MTTALEILAVCIAVGVVYYAVLGLFLLVLRLGLWAIDRSKTLEEVFDFAQDYYLALVMVGLVLASLLVTK